MDANDSIDARKPEGLAGPDLSVPELPAPETPATKESIPPVTSAAPIPVIPIPTPEPHVQPQTFPTSPIIKRPAPVSDDVPVKPDMIFTPPQSLTDLPERKTPINILESTGPVPNMDQLIRPTMSPIPAPKPIEATPMIRVMPTMPTAVTPSASTVPPAAPAYQNSRILVPPSSTITPKSAPATAPVAPEAPFVPVRKPPLNILEAMEMSPKAMLNALDPKQPPRPLYTTSVNSVPPGVGNQNQPKRLRTYESDVAEVLAQRGTSAVAMTLAENKKKSGEDRIGTAPEAKPDENAPSSHSIWKFFVVLMSVAIVAVGAGAAYYFYAESPLSAPAPAPSAQTSQAQDALVHADAQAVIATDNLTAKNILSRVNSEIGKTQDSGTVKEIVLTTVAGGSQARVAASDIAATMGIVPPDMFLRSLDPKWMLGIYADPNGAKDAFVVVKTNFFQNAFAGMLQWESSMPQALSAYIQFPTASSTYGGPQGKFKDEIIMNKDVRAFVDQTGATDFVYSFVDNSTMVVAGKDATIAEIVSRLENSAFVR